jgi:hypothetical protein
MALCVQRPLGRNPPFFQRNRARSARMHRHRLRVPAPSPPVRPTDSAPTPLRRDRSSAHRATLRSRSELGKFCSSRRPGPQRPAHRSSPTPGTLSWVHRVAERASDPPPRTRNGFDLGRAAPNADRITDRTIEGPFTTPMRSTQLGIREAADPKFSRVSRPPNFA